jgi:hypothetical protein
LAGGGGGEAEPGVEPSGEAGGIRAVSSEVGGIEELEAAIAGAAFGAAGEIALFEGADSFPEQEQLVVLIGLAFVDQGHAPSDVAGGDLLIELAAIGGGAPFGLQADMVAEFGVTGRLGEGVTDGEAAGEG